MRHSAGRERIPATGEPTSGLYQMLGQVGAGRACLPLLRAKMGCETNE